MKSTKKSVEVGRKKTSKHRNRIDPIDEKDFFTIKIGEYLKLTPNELS